MRRLIIGIAAICLATTAKNISLDGVWQFTTSSPDQLDETINLPGSMLTNGKGRPVDTQTQWVGSLYDSSYFHNPFMAKYRETGNIKFPFFLTPDVHYTGMAWYKKDIVIPNDWKKDIVELYLERPHITTTVYINGKEAGRDSSLSVPHVFDITPYVNFGASNEIMIAISNDISNVCVGQDSHSVTDQTQGNWNGIIGAIELRAVKSKRWQKLHVYPRIHDNSIDLKVSTTGTNHKSKIKITVTDPDGNTVANLTKKLNTDTATINVPISGEIALWSEHTPTLYTLQADIDGGECKEVRFGMRKISIDGRQIMLNDKPIWIRGTVGNCCFPETGYPPTDVDSWLNIFNKCKEYGLNSMRFHSYCPPEAAFIAADEVGFYLQPEGPSWPNHGVKLGNGMSIDHYLLEETQRMVDTYGNHPSFCMLAAGNEPAGNWVRWVTDFCDYWRSTGDNRRIYCGASVGGGWAWDPGSDYHVKGGARGLDWDNRQPQSTDDFYAQITTFTQKGRQPVTFDINEPFISHEQGQWCAFPDLTETDQYTGAYRAKNFEIFADLLSANGMESQAEKFLNASGRLQTLAYKYEIERNLRTPEYSGFQLLGLNDYSGQGTALVGVLNVHWREKGYCDANDWTEFCSDIVPLARFSKFVFADNEDIAVPIELYNAFDDIDSAEVTYNVTCGDRNVYSATKRFTDIPLGKNHPIGTVNFKHDTNDNATKYTLSVTVSQDGKKSVNHWDFWVYPANKPQSDPTGILITDTLDIDAIKHLEAGGNVLLTAAGKVRYGEDIKQTYLPVFWNTSWFKMRPPHTTGAVIDTDHPLFKFFPSDDWANLNWWELLNKAQVMLLSEMPKDYQSPVQPIDTWHISRKLGMILEANVLNGKIFMTTMDITNDIDKRLVAKYMRDAIIDYMQSDKFTPSLTVEPSLITNLYEKQSVAVDMHTNESPDELKPKLK